MPEITEEYAFNLDFPFMRFTHIYDKDEDPFDQPPIDYLISTNHTKILLLLNRDNDLWNQCKTDQMKKQYADEIDNAIETYKWIQENNTGKSLILTKEKEESIATECVYGILSYGIGDIFKDKDDPNVRALCDIILDYCQNEGIPFNKDWAERIGIPMIQVLLHDQKMKLPFVISVRPGLGKTEILIETLAYRVQNEPGFTALVVTNFVREGVRIRDRINNKTNSNVCYLHPSLNSETIKDDHCPAGYESNDYTYYLCPNCIKEGKYPDCPVYDAKTERTKYPVLIVSTERFLNSLKENAINDLLMYGTLKREYLFIDENPRLITSYPFTANMLSQVQEYLIDKNYAQDYINNYEEAMMMIMKFFGRKNDAGPIDKSFKINEEFKSKWRSDPIVINKRPYKDFLDGVEFLINKGYVRQSGNNHINYTLATAFYQRMDIDVKRTIVLDGTAAIDPTYAKSEFNIQIMPEIRQFKHLTLWRNTKSLSRTALKGKATKGLICTLEESIPVLSENRPTLVITYKDDLDDHFDKVFNIYDNIKVDHFGNLRGKNTYKDFVNLFILGLNDWGHLEYYSKHWAITDNAETNVDSNATIQSPKVARFALKLKATELYQDIMRIKIRNLNCSEPVNVYLFIKDDDLFNELRSLLPGCLVKDWDTVPDYSYLDSFKDPFKGMSGNLKQKRVAALASWVFNNHIKSRPLQKEELKHVYSQNITDIDKHWSDRYKKKADKVFSTLAGP